MMHGDLSSQFGLYKRNVPGRERNKIAITRFAWSTEDNVHDPNLASPALQGFSAMRSAKGRVLFFFYVYSAVPVLPFFTILCVWRCVLLPLRARRLRAPVRTMGSIGANSPTRAFKTQH